MNFGGSSLPCATPTYAPMPILAHSARSRTRRVSPLSSAISAARRARKVGVTTLAGSLTRSRARQVASAAIRPMRTPSRAAAALRRSGSSTVSARTTLPFFSFRYLSKR